PGADGIKTGYVRQSGRCLVASATHPEGGEPWRLIAVVLHSPDTYGDCAALLDYGFSHYQPLLFARRGEQVGMAAVRDGDPSEVPARAQQDLFAIVPRGSVPFAAPGSWRLAPGADMAARPASSEPGARSQAPGAAPEALERRVTLATLTAPVRRDQPIGTLS